jgi:hypothetical protein
MTAYVKVDEEEPEEVGVKSPQFLSKLLTGQSLLIEYHTETSDAPLFVRFSLQGFAEAWRQAAELKRNAMPAKPTD